MSRLMVTVAAGRGRYKTRTTGDAHLYRVVQYYDAWPFEPDSRVPSGSRSRKRTETFRTLEPVRQRLARANGYARYQRRNGRDWPAFVAVAEQLTDDGWQPLDLDFPPPRPARDRRGRSGRTRHSRHGGAPAVAGRDPAAPARPQPQRRQRSVHGGLTDFRTGQHGIRPLPASLPGTGQPAPVTNGDQH